MSMWMHLRVRLRMRMSLKVGMMPMCVALAPARGIHDAPWIILTLRRMVHRGRRTFLMRRVRGNVHRPELRALVRHRAVRRVLVRRRDVRVWVFRVRCRTGGSGRL